MVDEYQIEYEYTDGNTITFKTNDLRITFLRPKMRVDVRVDGTKVVTDPGNKQRVFMFSSIIAGSVLNTLNTVQTGAITYSGAYPRIKTIYFAGGTTITNIEVALTSLTAQNVGDAQWAVVITLTEKDQ